jgi:hypothetical protein
MPGSYPLSRQELAARFGSPASVEHARSRWSEIVKEAASGSMITLIASGRAGQGPWAAVVPPDEAPGPSRCPVWPLIEARARLGDVVQAATDYRDPVPQLISRYRRPVAAVIAASILDPAAPADGERVDVRTILEQGGKVTLEYDTSQSGAAGEQSDVVRPSGPGGFEATAADRRGTVIGLGAGNTPVEALLRIRAFAEFPEPANHPYSDEPPF